MRRRAACASTSRWRRPSPRRGARAGASGRHRRRCRHAGGGAGAAADRHPREAAISKPEAGHDIQTDPTSVSAVSALKRWGMRTLGELAALPAADLAARLGRGALALAGGRARRRHAAAGAGAARGALRRDARARVADRGARVAVVRADAAARAAVDTSRASRSRRRRPARRPAARAARRARRDVRAPSRAADADARRAHAAHAGAARSRVASAARRRSSASPSRSIRRRGVCCSTRLFTRAQPTPEQLSTLLARLGALMGQDRIGAAATVDSYRPGAFAMRPFAVEHEDNQRRDAEIAENVSVQNSAGSANSALNVVSSRSAAAASRCRRV